MNEGVSISIILGYLAPLSSLFPLCPAPAADRAGRGLEATRLVGSGLEAGWKLEWSAGGLVEWSVEMGEHCYHQ